MFPLRFVWPRYADTQRNASELFRVDNAFRMVQYGGQEMEIDMTQQYKHYCPTCDGKGVIYVGTGHRSQSNLLLEKMASDGKCPNCDNINLPHKPVDPEQIAADKARLNAKMDAAVAKLSAQVEKTRAEINATRAANGLPPFPSYADT